MKHFFRVFLCASSATSAPLRFTLPINAMTDTNKLIRSITVEAKIISEADGLVDYIASNAALDSYQERVAVDGWRFTRFAKNAPFVDSHDYWSIEKLLGRVTQATVQNRNLVERVQWAKDVEENKLARLGWKMTLGGFLKAVSVGFFPVKYVRNGGEGWSQALASLGLKPEDETGTRYIYLEQEQIELSACIIGANPEALAKSYQEGCVKDADLASVGFADDDMHFLTIAGQALALPDTTDLTRALIAREMGRITGSRKPLSQQSKTAHPSTSPGKPRGGENAEREAAERKALLEALNRI